MKPDKKPRSDSKLDAMPESRVLELRDKLLAGESYNLCLEWLSLECGVDSSLAALSSFYKRHCWPMIRDRRQVAVIKAEALGDAMEQDPVAWDAKIIEKVKQRVFEFLSSDTASPEELMLVVDAVTKANKDTRDDERVRLEREKFEEAKRKAMQADAAKDVLGQKLSMEEQNRRLREILK